MRSEVETCSRSNVSSNSSIMPLSSARFSVIDDESQPAMQTSGLHRRKARAKEAPMRPQPTTVVLFTFISLYSSFDRTSGLTLDSFAHERREPFSPACPYLTPVRQPGLRRDAIRE